MDVLIRRSSESRNEKKKRETLAAIGHLMTGIAASPILLMEVVAGGPMEFRNRFLREMRGFAVDGNVADSIFKFFCDKVVQLHTPSVDAQPQAGAFLDAVEINEARQFTEQEIEDAWEVTIASSEDAMSRFWEGSARVRKGGNLGMKQVH